MCNCCNNEPREPIQFVIGDGQPLTPIVGSNTYTNPSIKYDKYYIVRNGYGVMVEGTDYNRLATGGIQLVGADTFNSNEVFTFFFF